MSCPISASSRATSPRALSASRSNPSLATFTLS
eukprot:CAMPEP_0175871128 /NCGR_PEP_ID=MMETSP0107_2-20121207/36958_1 /TAXON_ID=195067 ORGANISM="Goniomonas pacifica, Strain CCMP1869" /NCGR_SAMPLE_ID=MMETSP0107_2 /ASSEMBLY_ACC=CAM_ASM_000203 /LENGTH=32 /DNA_ID= /DNA_START= /DNA_END= /DNA_ORIENTATION=